MTPSAVSERGGSTQGIGVKANRVRPPAGAQGRRVRQSEAPDERREPE